MVSEITAWGVRWTGLTHSPKTDRDRLIEDNQQLHTAIKHIISSIVTQSRVIKEKGGVIVGECHGSVAECWQFKLTLGLTHKGTTFLSFLLPFQRSSDSNGPDLQFYDFYQSLDCGGVLSIGLPML